MERTLPSVKKPPATSSVYEIDPEKSPSGKGSSDLSVNATALEPLDPRLELRVRRKIDLVILSVFFFIYMFQYLDKIALSYTAIFGMETDLGFVGQDYSWCSSIFYFGQLFFEFPVLKLLHIFPIKRFVGVTVVLWGIVMMTSASPHNFAGMMVVRFFLGLSEGAVAPAFVVLTSIWWKKREHPIRIAVFVSANACAQILGGLLLYGCGSITGTAITGWRISLLIAGGVTILLGFTLLLVVPKSPAEAWFLTPEERECAVKRVARERASAQHSEWRNDQMLETLKDPKFYLIFLWAVFVCMTSVVSFGSIVIKGLGFDSFTTVLVGLPGPGLQLICIWAGVLACKAFPNSRSFIQTLLIIPPFVGVIMMTALPYERKWALTVGYWLATCNSSVFVVNMSLIASNFKGHTRKTLVSTVYFIGYCVGCICGPQLFISTESPLYPTAMHTCIALYCLYMLAQMLYWYLCKLENARRDRLVAEGESSALPKPASDEDNSTDGQDLAFRYVL